MFCITTLANGASLETVGNKLRDQLYPTWLNGLMIWTPVSLFQQALAVPRKTQGFLGFRDFE